MQVVIIGTGNVATVLAKKVKAAGHIITQIYGRNLNAAHELAMMVNAAACSKWEEIETSSNIYIIALTDQALQNGIGGLSLHDKLVVHTAGSVTKQVLSRVSSNYGVLYPLQSIRKEIEPAEIPFLIDAASETSKEQLLGFAKSISDKVSFASDEQRLQYHLCAVLTNNFSNHLYTLAADYCMANGLEFSVLIPLLKETVSRLQYHSPQQVQTGPAVRGDWQTMKTHLNLLDGNKDVQDMYTFFSNNIMAYYGKK